MKYVENLNVGGLPVNRPHEQKAAAAILCHVYNGLFEDFITQRTSALAEARGKIDKWKKLTVVFAIIPIALVAMLNSIMPGILAAGVIIPLFMLKSAMKEYERIVGMKCDARVTKIGKFSWKGKLIPFQGGAMLVDDSDTVPKKDFSFPLMKTPLDTIWSMFQEIDSSLSDLPVIQERIEGQGGDDGESAVRGKLEKELSRMFDTGKKYFDNHSMERLKIGIFQGRAPTPKYIHTHWNELREIRDLGGIQMSSEFRKLERLWKSAMELSRELPPEQIQGYLDSFAKELNYMDDVREHTLIKHISEQLEKLDMAYKLNNVIVYCPSCYRKSTAESDTYMSENVVMIDNRAEDKHIDHEDTESLSKMMNIKDQIIRSSRMTFDFRERVWICPLCETPTEYGSDELTMHRVKNDIVYPLWDSLWQELDVERNRIRREKETELRENKKYIHSEMMQLQKDFVEERRLIKTKTEDLYEKSKKTIVQLKSMVKAFDGMGILGDKTSGEQQRKIESYSSTHSKRLKELTEHLVEAEEDVANKVRTGFQGKESITDYVDEVRASGRFLTEKKEGKPELLIGGE